MRWRPVRWCEPPSWSRAPCSRWAAGAGPTSAISLTATWSPSIATSWAPSSSTDYANQVITAGAGMGLAQLQEILGSHNQWLPLRPPLADACTLGGCAALGARAGTPSISRAARPAARPPIRLRHRHADRRRGPGRQERRRLRRDPPDGRLGRHAGLPHRPHPPRLIRGPRFAARSPRPARSTPAPPPPPGSSARTSSRPSSLPRLRTPPDGTWPSASRASRQRFASRPNAVPSFCERLDSACSPPRRARGRHSVIEGIHGRGTANSPSPMRRSCRRLIPLPRPPRDRAQSTPSSKSPSD